jgi:hypothetical protein
VPSRTCSLLAASTSLTRRMNTICGRFFHVLGGVPSRTMVISRDDDYDFGAHTPSFYFFLGVFTVLNIHLSLGLICVRVKFACSRLNVRRQNSAPFLSTTARRMRTVTMEMYLFDRLVVGIERLYTAVPVVLAIYEDSILVSVISPEPRTTFLTPRLFQRWTRPNAVSSAKICTNAFS